MPREVVLAEDDFSAFPLGPIHEDHTAAREYHVLEPQRERGMWREATVHPSWRRGPGTWRVAFADGRRVLEQATFSEAVPALIVCGDERWEDYQVSVKLRALSLAGPVGVVVGYRHSRSYICAAVQRGRFSLVLREHEREEVLASAEGEVPSDEYVTVRVALGGGKAVAQFEPGPRLEASVGRRGGKVGLLAQVPARFAAFCVTTSAAAHTALRERTAREQGELEELRRSYPQPQLLRTIATPGFGSDRNLRFGDLNGDGKLEIVVAQKRSFVDSGNFSMISCLTAIDLEGNILWQRGEPNPAHTHATADLCFQVHDLDGDGRAEVIFCQDFALHVADGETGEVIAATPTPPARGRDSFVGGPYFERVMGDSIYFADLRGLGAPRDIVLKDRYAHFWVFDEKLELRWAGECNTGHFPTSFDVDGDGCEELMVGYTLFDHDGEELFSLELEDHADAIAIGDFGEGEIRIALAAGDAGFVLCDVEGKIVARHKLGHVQKLSAAKLRQDVQGVQFAAITYWGCPGIMAIFDCRGQLLEELEPMHYASPLCPVNWTGQAPELLLLSAHPAEGGLVDGYGRRVVMFPDDGHPTLCCAALDLFGTGRDNVLTWSPEEIAIYAAEGQPPAEPYRPLRNLLCNESNYKANISLAPGR